MRAQTQMSKKAVDSLSEHIKSQIERMAVIKASNAPELRIREYMRKLSDT